MAAPQFTMTVKNNNNILGLTRRIQATPGVTRSHVNEVFHEASGNASKLKAYLNARTKGNNHTQAMINTFKKNYSANLKNFIKSYIRNLTNAQVNDVINASNRNFRRVKAYVFARVVEGYKNHEVAKQRMKLFTPHLFNMMNKSKFFT